MAVLIVDNWLLVLFLVSGEALADPGEGANYTWLVAKPLECSNPAHIGTRSD